MAISIKIDTRGLDVPKAALRILQYRIKNYTPALFEAGRDMEATLDRRFQAGGGASSFGGPYKPWARNRPSTIKRKGHARVLIGGGRNAGKLRHSIRAVARANTLRITYAGYGRYAMEGFTARDGSHVAPRPFAYPTQGDLNNIIRLITRYIVDGPS